MKLPVASGPHGTPDGSDGRDGLVLPVVGLATGCRGDIGNGETDAVVALKEISEDER